MVRVMCCVQFKHRKRAKDFSMKIDLFTMANNLHWYCYMLRRVEVMF